MIPVFDPLRLSAVSLDVMAAGRATPGQVAARQATRLAQLLDSARNRSAFYRRRLPERPHAGGAAALATLPVVTRGELMANFDRWVTDPALRLDGLREFVADPARIGEPWLGRYVVWESSGTSGEPGIFVQDAQTMAVYDALEALRRSAPGHRLNWTDPLGLTERYAFVGATEGHFASYVTLRRLWQINPWLAQASRSFSIMQPVGELVRALNAWAPTSIATYPTAAALLADEAERGTLRIRPREVWTGGETLSEAVRERVQRVLGASLRNSYGSSEFLAMGWECAEGCLHLNADWLILEPVDEHHRPMPPGEPSSSVLLTHLANTVQPLIRYDLGDQVTWRGQTCRCGSPLPVIEVQGRRDEPLVMDGPGGQSVTLLPMALTSVLEVEGGVFDFHLRQQDRRTLVLRLPLSGEAAQGVMARCRRALQTYATAQGALPIRVVEEVSQPVPRGRSGKACRILAMAPD